MKVLEKAFEAYEDYRAKYVGGIRYHGNNKEAFKGAMKKALDALDIIILDKDAEPIEDDIVEYRFGYNDVRHDQLMIKSKDGKRWKGRQDLIYINRVKKIIQRNGKPVLYEEDRIMNDKYFPKCYVCNSAYGQMSPLGNLRMCDNCRYEALEDKPHNPHNEKHTPDNS